MREINLGRVLIENRHRLGVTQEELASHIGVSKAAVSKWETGEALPDLNSLKKLAVTLGFSIDRAMGIDIEDEDDNSEWLIIGGFIVGNALGMAFDNLMLGYIFAVIGLGMDFIMKAFKKRRYPLPVIYGEFTACCG